MTFLRALGSWVYAILAGFGPADSTDGAPGPAPASSVPAGRYLCLRTRSPLGWLVRQFCGSPYDHTVLVTGPNEVIEATVRGVKRTPLSRFAGCLAVASPDPVAPTQRAAVVRAAWGYVGDEYGFAYLLVIAAAKIGARWAWLRRLTMDRDAVICSELAVLCGIAAGEDWLCGEALPALVRPDQLAAREGCYPVTIT